MKNKKIVLISLISAIIFIFFTKEYLERTTKMKVVLGKKTEYTYFERNLTVEDFNEFDYDTTWDELIEKVGSPNGACAFGNPYPYYELSNGEYIVCRFLNHQLDQIRVCTENRLYKYFLLPCKLSEMNKEQKIIELKYAKNFEMNEVLEMIIIARWNDLLWKSENKDDSFGLYNKNLLNEYSDKDLNFDFSYFFGTYVDSGFQYLFQIMESYEDGKQKHLVLKVWSDKVARDKMYYIMDEDENILDFTNDMDLSGIKLTYIEFANSIKDFLKDRKEIGNCETS